MTLDPKLFADLAALKNPPPLIINAALTGVMPTKEQNPNLPVTVDEIVADGLRCLDGGASILHLHARNEDGIATCAPALYAEILTRLRKERPEAILCATTTQRGVCDPADRMGVLDLTGDAKPDMASLTMGSVDFRNVSVSTSAEAVREKAAVMKERGIMPELEVFHSGMLNTLRLMLGKGQIATPAYCNFILGSPHMAQGTLAELNHLVATLPPGVHWAAGGAGYAQPRVNMMAVVLGGHVRVGLEDNLWMDPERSEPATNQGLVERVARLAGEIGRPVATPVQARRMLGLP